jgi:hypothetical protein
MMLLWMLALHTHLMPSILALYAEGLSPLVDQDTGRNTVFREYQSYPPRDIFWLGVVFPTAC